MSKRPFDEWWDKEGRDLFQRADGWLVAKAAWDAAIKNADQLELKLAAAAKEIERLRDEIEWGPPGGP